MKKISYKESNQIDFEGFYGFLRQLLIGCKYKSVIVDFNNANNYKELQLFIRDNLVACNYFFKKLKLLADNSDNYIELEKYLVYMNALLGGNYLPLIIYKKRLLTLIQDDINSDNAVDWYCVIRQLTSINDGVLKEMFENKVNNYSDFSCIIYLIEGKYSKVNHKNIIKSKILDEYRIEYKKYILNEKIKSFKTTIGNSIFNYSLAR